MKLNSHASDVVGLRLPGRETTPGRVINVGWPGVLVVLGVLAVAASWPCCRAAWPVQIKINDALTTARHGGRGTATGGPGWPHKNYFTCGYTMSQRLSCPTWP